MEIDVDEAGSSIWMARDLVLVQVGLSVEPAGSWTKTPGMINFKVKGEPGLVVWVDEIEARILDSETKHNARGAILGRFWQRLLADGFEDYENHEELKAYGGWAVKQALEGYGDIPVTSIQPGQLALLLQGYDIYRTRKIRKDTRSLAVPDDVEFLSGRKSMRITVSNEGLTEAIKILSLPEGIPFAISQNKFKIVERPGAFERVKERLRTRWEEAGVDGSISGYRPSSGAAIDRLKRMDGSKVGSGGDLRTMSVGTVGIYYIYAFDGRLLAEYDGYGDCLREYIYIGAKMVAEYQPATEKYYYYTTDQVNSTRVVTDDEGNVVYSAAFDPYGGVQQTWVNTFNPEWKFSGHEQDPESSLYYFGARYYDPGLYRFLCPDPVFGESLMRNDTRHWNLYIYCLGSPINYIDISGLWVAHAMINIYRVPGNWRHPSEGWQFFGDKVARTRLDSGNIYLTRNDKGKEELLFYFHFSIYIYNDDCLSYWGTNYNRVLKHELSHVEFYMRHLKPVLTWIEKKYFKEVEKLGADKALENAKNRLSRYVDWIGRINAFWIDEMRGLGYQFWKDINDNWIQWVDDPFNKWLLGLDYCF